MVSDSKTSGDDLAKTKVRKKKALLVHLLIWAFVASWAFALSRDMVIGPTLGNWLTNEVRSMKGPSPSCNCQFAGKTVHVDKKK